MVREDAYEFLIAFMEWLHALRLLESRGVEFITYQFDEAARHWWWTYKDTRSTATLPVIWIEFIEAFMTRFVPGSFRDSHRDQFVRMESS